MTHLYLIRHAAFRGDGTVGDPGLTDAGIQQSELLRDRLVASHELAADVVIASTKQRARQTAEIIAPALGKPLLFDDDVQEWRNDNHTISSDIWFPKLVATHPAQQPFFVPFPGCETLAQFAVRATTALNRITQSYPDQTVVIVCHGGIIEASFLLAYGLSPLAAMSVMLNMDPDYTSITHWNINAQKNRWRLEQYNDNYHLRDASAKLLL